MIIDDINKFKHYGIKINDINIDPVNYDIFWNDDKVIDFVNWYIDLHKLDFRYQLENKTIIDSFKNGDAASKWHSH